MADSSVLTPETKPAVQRVDQSRQAWRNLGIQIASVTPKQLGRMVLGLGAVAAAIWVVVASWPALLPFLVGGVIGYTVLPIVNSLDKVLPRLLAALVGVIIPLAVVAGLAYVIIPPLVTQIMALVQDLPDAAEIQTITTRIASDSRFGQLPALVQSQLLAIVTNGLLRGREIAEGIVPAVLGGRPFLTVVNAFSTVLGLLVLPTWTLLLLKDQPRVWPTFAGVFPPGMRRDVRAYIRIVDNAFGTFLRGQVVIGLAVGLATYAGLYLMDRYLGLVTPNKIPLAVLSGLLQLIPEVGPMVNVLGTTLLAFLVFGRTAAVEILGLYLLIQFITGKLVADRFESKVIDVHPAALVLVIVALSQLGPFWFFLAAPIASVARDIWRYTFGRLKEPGLPAGVLPSQREAYQRRLAQQQAARPLPAVYRRR
jgi:predicted PurR-regulated permease PerM